MKRCWMVLFALLFITTTSGRALADNATILKEIQTMKERIEELEQKLEEQESLAKRQVSKTEKNIEDKIGEALEERFGTLEIHGGAILYYQGSQTDELDGAKADSPSGAGFTADLELTWKPALPLVEDGQFYARIHAGDGTGADRGGRTNNPVNVLLGNLNTIADDNTGGNDTSLNLLDAFYTHEFFDKTLSVTGGKAKNLLFLDGNAFANNEKQQFVGKPFVNNSVLDSESEYTPLLGGEFKPMELLAFSVVGTSTSRPNVEGTPLENTAKSKYDNVFSTPFLGSQLTRLPQVRGVGGQLPALRLVCRLQPLQARQRPQPHRREKGQGLGRRHQRRPAGDRDDRALRPLRLEQRRCLRGAVGGLRRCQPQGADPRPRRGQLWRGLCRAHAGGPLRENDPEYHLELYYRIAVTENLAFSPGHPVRLEPRRRQQQRRHIRRHDPR